MATAAELGFYDAIIAAENARQNAKSAAFTVYNFNPAGLATYRAALIAADVAYITAVLTAATAAGISPGAASLTGPIPHAKWAAIGRHG